MIIEERTATSAPLSRPPRLGPWLAAASLIGVFLLGSAAGWWGHWYRTDPTAIAAREHHPLRPGPWGELEYIPFTFAATPETLPVRTMEQEPLRWFFSGHTQESFTRFLDLLDLSPEQKAVLLQPDNLKVLPTGLQITPPRDVFVALTEKSRLKIFQQLVPYQENSSLFTFLPEASLAERFREAHVSKQTVDLVRHLSCLHGKNRVFSGIGFVLASIPTYEEKTRFLQALTRQKSLLLRLHLTSSSDVSALSTYWGKAVWNTDVHAMLDSLSHVPGGTWLDIVELLPPFPTSLLYTFPVPQNPMNGPVQQRDCHWTSFNFFRDPPDPHVADVSYFLERLRLDYYPVETDSRYGDLVLFSKPNGDIIHSAILLADDILYTKNGNNPLHPWILSTMEDILEQYSWTVEPNEQLKVSYFRNKYY